MDTPAQPGCVFCQIISGEVHGHVVLETDDLVAFLDARPVFKGHVLLVPRVHVDTLPDLPAELRATPSWLPRSGWRPPPRWASARRGPSSRSTTP